MVLWAWVRLVQATTLDCVATVPPEAPAEVTAGAEVAGVWSSAMVENLQETKT